MKGSSAVITGIISGAGSSRTKNIIRNQGVVGQSIDETLARMGTLSHGILALSDAVLLQIAGVEKVRR